MLVLFISFKAFFNCFFNYLTYYLLYLLLLIIEKALSVKLTFLTLIFKAFINLNALSTY
jgi:hypothetical protein